MKKLWDVLSGRIARNLYLWGYVYYLRLSFDAYNYPPLTLAYCVLLSLVLALCLYGNNLLLVPQLLSRRRYVLYFISAAALIFGTSTLSSAIVVYLIKHHPVIDISRVIWVPMDPSTFTEQMPVLQFMHCCVFALELIVFTLCWYGLRFSRKQEELEDIKEKQTEIELAFLKNQLNPHFLFNTLNNLYGLTLKKSDSAPDCILKLSLIMRYVLYESERQTVSFEKEKSIMEAYIDLELLRLSKDRTDMQFEITADKDYQLPPLLWMPILENLFKHGTRHIASAMLLRFSCTIINGKLCIISENRYKANAPKEKAGGIGLENLRKRLSILYPKKHQLQAAVKEDMYLVTLEIDLA